MHLLDPRNGPDWDLPPTPTSGTWVVASVPRSGSTLLCRTLWDTGRIGAPKEYLNPMQIRDWEVRLGRWPARVAHRALRGPLVGLAGRGWWTDRRLRGHLERVRARRTGPSGWFGLKIHWHHLEQWFLSQERPPVPWLEATRWIRIRRTDQLAQAVSWARALQTGAWAAHQSPWVRPRYSRSRIRRCLAAIKGAEGRWDRFFAARDLHPLEITYVSLVDDLGGTVRRVFAHLNLPYDDEVPPPSLRRQADEVNEAWIRRYRSGR